MCQNQQVPNKKYLPRHSCQQNDIICYVLLFFVNEIVIWKRAAITDAHLFRMTYHLKHNFQVGMHGILISIIPVRGQRPAARGAFGNLLVTSYMN